MGRVAISAHAVGPLFRFGFPRNSHILYRIDTAHLPANRTHGQNHVTTKDSRLPSDCVHENVVAEDMLATLDMFVSLAVTPLKVCVSF